MVLPVIAVIGLAFSSWTGFNIDDVSYTGLSNFRELPHDELFVRSLLHTVAFVALSTVALNILGFSLAMLINSRVQGHDFLRIAMFVPLGLSPVITGVIWQQLLGPYGLVNSALDSLHLVSQPVQFLGDPDLAFWTVIAAAIWQYSGYNMLLYYAGLQSLPRERVEAASIDGAGPIARFRHIIVPYMRPVIAVVIVLNLIGGWKVFELVYVLTGRRAEPRHRGALDLSLPAGLHDQRERVRVCDRARDRACSRRCRRSCAAASTESNSRERPAASLSRPALTRERPSERAPRRDSKRFAGLARLPAGRRRLPRAAGVGAVRVVPESTTTSSPRSSCRTRSRPGNYADAWDKYGLGVLFLNSTLITAGTVVLSLGLSVTAAYGFSRHRTRLREGVFLLILTGLMIPPAAIIIPFFVLMNDLHLYDKLFSVVLAETAFVLPLGILILRGYVDNIPVGAERCRTCGRRRRVDGLPARRSCRCCARRSPRSALLITLSTWNGFLLPLVLISDPSQSTVTVGIAQFAGQFGVLEWQLVAAAAVMAMLPVLVVLVALRRYYVQGLSAGALKG